MPDPEKTTPSVPDFKAFDRDVDIPSSSGWQNIARTVHEVDEAKVNDAKEDIDNLLVFAGLFSAILTAFLIESYTALQPDTESEIVFILHRMATQNYTVSSGFLNVTSPLPQRQPFEAPLWALRVNGLWFASLILSLSAASLGILVKAWLREYLSSDWISPKEKLRSRQYRHPALSQWKVFEIAATLPLLLQLALGLFFLGLCFFTASVDERMALTSVPLVCAWAFFLGMTTIAPLLNPRCPFKVPGIKRVLKSGRRHLLPRLTRLLSTASGVTVSWNFEEEEAAVSKEQDDMELLLEMDALSSDDSLLPMFWTAFKRSASDQSRNIQFLLRLMRHRLPTLPEITPLASSQIAYFVNLDGLSRRAYDTFMTVLADLLKKAPVPYKVPSPDWVHDTVILLLSPSAYPYPANVLSTLRTYLDDSKVTWMMGDTIGIRVRPALEHGAEFLPMSAKFHSVYSAVLADVPSISTTSPLRFYNKILQSLGQVSDDSRQSTLLGTLRSTPELGTNTKLRPIFEDIWLYLHCTLIPLSSSKQNVPDGTNECLFTAMHFGCTMGYTRGAAHVLRQFWLNHHKRWMAMSQFATTTIVAPLDARDAVDLWPIIEQTWGLTDQKTLASMMGNSTEFLNDYSRGQYTVEKKYESLDIVQVVHVHLRLYEQYLQSLDVDVDARYRLSAEWKKLWDKAHLAIRKYWDLQGWKATPFKRAWTGNVRFNSDRLMEWDRESAARCLGMIDASDSVVGSTSSLTNSIPFPDELVTALGLFILPENVSVFPRLSRLCSAPR